MCQVTITSVTGSPNPSNGTTILNIQGTSTGCELVKVVAYCPNGSKYTSPVINATAGNWQCQIQIDCLCREGHIRVEACCVDSAGNPIPGCICDTYARPIPCCCPGFNVQAIIGECENGQRPVTFSLSTTITDERCLPIAVYLDFGDGPPNSSPVSLTFGPNNLTFSHLYNPGNYTAVLHFIQPDNCPPVNVPVTIRPCDTPIDCCPNAVAVITSEVAEKCNKDEKTKYVKVDAVITPIARPGCPVNIQAVMYIDNNQVASGSGSSPFTLSYSADFPCGDHTVTIKYPGSDCPDSGGAFCVSVCESIDCLVKRNSFETAATVAIISWILYLFNQTYTSLLILAVSTTVIAIWLFLVVWRPCRIICKKCPCLLAFWAIALASFLGFFILSNSTLTKIYNWLVGLMSSALGPYVAGVIAVIIIVLILLVIALIIYLLFINWLAKCCPTNCEKWTYLFETLLLCGFCFGVVAAVASTSGPVSIFWIIPYQWAIAAWGLLTTIVYWKKKIACL